MADLLVGWYCAAACVIALAATVADAWSTEASYTGGGLALGLWLAALVTWLSDEPVIA